MDATEPYIFYFKPRYPRTGSSLRTPAAKEHCQHELSAVYHDLLKSARDYHRLTGNHLDKAYGHIGELHGAVRHAISLNRTGAQGADGRMGNHHVEIKTISPRSIDQKIRVKLENRHFDRLLVVRITPDFMVEDSMIERRKLPTKGKKSMTVRWSALAALV